MDSDLEIARQAELLPIREVAESIGLDRDDLRLHGPHIAKVNWARLKQCRGSGKGKLILVTSVNPTPFGEAVSYTHLTLPTKRIV